VIEDPCPTCRGSGVEKRARQVKARIPAGVNDGQTIRLKGRGGPGFNGGPPGDLLVDIRVTPDPHFGRSGLDLTVRVTIDFWQAALGDVIGVPTLRGPDVVLRVKSGTQPGSRHRVRGKGISTPQGTGDLIVTIDVEVPRDLTREQRAAIEALKAAGTVEEEVAAT
jgi:molecular chaperone DnaJ